MSIDGLNAGQANKFAKRFKLTNLRLEGGYWIAEDGGELYTISAENYWGAWNEGDLG